MQIKHKLLKPVFYNLIGLGIPLVAAVVSIPLLIESLGLDRFGLLTLIWAVVSYFGLFDMGLGRVLTQQLAIIFAKKENERIGPLVATATVLMAVLGVIAGLLMIALAPWGVGLLEGVPDQQEVINAVYLMALAMPAIILTACFRGILEAKHAFGILNLIRLPMGLFTFLGPLAMVIYGQSRIDWITLVLVTGRVLFCAVHAWYAWRALPIYRGSLTVQANLIKTISVSGGWITVSNIVSPFMGYIDRFLIGAMVSSSAVTYYVTSQELITKLSILPGALTAVIFPIFTAKIALCDSQTLLLFKSTVHGLFLLLLPVTVFIALFAQELLTFWINSYFANQSAIFMQVFAVGVLINCLAQIAFSVIQSAGASKLTAQAHLIELPFFLIALWLLISAYGNLGAAVAWFLRIGLDAVLMFTFCNRILLQPSKNLFSNKVLGFGLLAAIGFAGMLIHPMIVRLLCVVLITGVSALLLMTWWKKFRLIVFLP